MKHLSSVFALALLGFAPMAAGAETTEKHKADANQGMTFEDIGRGLKSAANNIGNEIPKIGPAIADTFKKVTGSDKDKASESGSAKSSSNPSSSKEKK